LKEKSQPEHFLKRNTDRRIIRVGNGDISHVLPPFLNYWMVAEFLGIALSGYFLESKKC
jgi:hypothetical protein